MWDDRINISLEAVEWFAPEYAEIITIIKDNISESVNNFLVSNNLQDLKFNILYHGMCDIDFFMNNLYCRLDKSSFSVNLFGYLDKKNQYVINVVLNESADILSWNLMRKDILNETIYRSSPEGKWEIIEDCLEYDNDDYEDVYYYELDDDIEIGNPVNSHQKTINIDDYKKTFLQKRAGL